MPKLSPLALAIVTGEAVDLTKLPKWETYGTATRAALALAQGGVRVFPCWTPDICEAGGCSEARKSGAECKSPGKHPRVTGGVGKATDNLARVQEWADQWPDTNWGQALDSRVVIDIDVAEGKEGVAQWDELLIKRYPDRNPSALPYLPEDLRTLQYRTGRGGTQLVFLRPEGVREHEIPGKLRDHIDIKRGSRSYVMVPGSWTEEPYEVTRETEPLILPQWVVHEAKNRAKAEKAAKTRAAKAAGSPSGKGLSAQLALPTDHADKGNEWMTSALGYLAAGLRREEDLMALARIINATQLSSPMTDAELLKIARSVVESELRNHHGSKDGVDENADALHNERNGYLALTDDRHSLAVLNNAGQGEDMIALPVTYLDCGLVPKYVVDNGDDRWYAIDVYGPNHKDAKTAVIRAETLVDSKKRDAWLAGLGYVVSPPFHAVYELADKARLLRYVEAQKPARGRAVEYLGWHGADFLTPDGVLRDGELVPFDGRIPQPQAVEQSMAAYGTTVEKEELVSVLQEVWTFQEPQVASVAMAWWVMCLLKGTYKSSIAPILYVDAPSGSGKTNGFFAFLVALAGNTSGSGSITVPRVRHQLASNQSGIVWVDDMTEIRQLAEVLRQAASRGTHTKTDTTDNLRTIHQHMVGNVLLSCEGLGRTLDEKAFRDRVIRLKVQSVKGRMSLRNPEEVQWWDVVNLLARYGNDYAAFARKMAGTAVALVSDYATISLKDYMREGDGRHAEKHAILRAGARILADVLGFEDPVRHVDDWIAGDEDKGGENLFVGHLAGRVWRELGQPTGPTIERYGTKRPAAVWQDSDGLIYVSPEHCADEIVKLRDADARDRQLGTREAIVAELQECGLKQTECRAKRRVGGAQVFYWRLPEVLSRRVRGAAPAAHRASEDRLL